MPIRAVALCAGLLLYPIGEWAIFGSGWYTRFLDPDSFAGRLKFTLGIATSPAEIAVIGNSILAEGFSAKFAGGTRFQNLSLPGSTPRCWYYLLRAADPTIHSNTIEGYFSIFKRGMKGIYQHCGDKHLHRYLAEFDFRYSNRKALGVEDAERADKLLQGFKGKRLTYQSTAS
jgi:hypothetical protein